MSRNSVNVTVSREGKISLPVQLRREAGITPGSRVAIRTEGSKIIVQSIEALLDDLQEEARRLMAGTNDSVDQFLADKYAEAAREYDS